VLYLLSACDRLRWANFDDASVVFNPLTGDTHLLNPFPALLLQELEKDPADLQHLCQISANACDEEVNETWRANVQHVISQLEAVDLIESQPICV